MKKLLLCLGLWMGITMAQAKENRENIYYQLNFKVHNMMCKVKLNGMPIINTMDIAKGIPKLISMIQPLGDVIDEGKNVLELEGTNAGEYVNGNGYCQATITASARNPETDELESKTVSEIRYTYEKDPSDNPEFVYLMSTKTSKALDPILAADEITLQRLPDIYDADKLPVQEVIASRAFTVNHSQPYRWIHRSTPFTDTPANRQLLWQKYNEIRQAILTKDKKSLRQLVEPGVTDVANAAGKSVELHFETVYSQIIEGFMTLDKDIWQLELLDMAKFNLEIYAEGKLFRFNENNKSMASPLQWKNTITGEYKRFNPNFTYIDGKIVMAIF